MVGASSMCACVCRLEWGGSCEGEEVVRGCSGGEGGREGVAGGCS